MVYDKVVKLCRERGIPVTKLEDMAGLGHGTIGKWKNVDPQIGNVKKVANALEVPVSYLLDES